MCANLYGCQRFVIVLRPPSDRIPFAVQSDVPGLGLGGDGVGQGVLGGVRGPIGFRLPSDDKC